MLKLSPCCRQESALITARLNTSKRCLRRRTIDHKNHIVFQAVLANVEIGLQGQRENVAFPSGLGRNADVEVEIVIPFRCRGERFREIF